MFVQFAVVILTDFFTANCATKPFKITLFTKKVDFFVKNAEKKLKNINNLLANL